MEFVDYYRIIRERVAIPILLAVLCAGAMAVRQALRPAEPRRAVGTISVNTAVLSQLRVAQDSVSIEEPEWRDIAPEVAGVVGGRAVRREVARRVPGVGAELADRPDFLRAEAVRNVPAVRVTATAAEADSAVAAAGAAMQASVEVLGELQRERFQATRDEVDGQLRAARRRLSTAQQRLTAAQTRYGTGDPAEEVNQLNGDLASLRGTRTRLLLERQSVTAREAVLGDAIEQQPLHETTEQIQPGIPASVAPGELEPQLAAAIAELQEAMKRRTPRHPEVVEMQRRIEELRRQLGNTASASGVVVAARIPNPLRADLQGQLWDTRSSIASIDAQLHWIEAQTAETRTRLSNLAAVLPEHKRLTDDASGAQASVDRLQKAAAEISGSMAAMAEAGPAEVLEEAAILPREWGLRRLVLRAGMAMVLGAVLGCTLAFFLHYTDVSFKDEESVERLLGQPMFGAIPRSDMPIGGRGTDVAAPAEEEQPRS